MSTIEQEILSHVQHLNDAQKQEVLAYVRILESAADTSRMSARELMKLPPDKRQQQLTLALAQAAEEDFELFEAYSEETAFDAMCEGLTPAELDEIVAEMNEEYVEPHVSL